MLQGKTVEPATRELLKDIVSLPEVVNFRLVGGTALSALYGHTKSIDLDLFTDQPLDKELLVNTLQERFERVLAVNGRFKSIYQCTIQNVKVDFVSVKYSFLYLAKVIEKIPLPI